MELCAGPNDLHSASAEGLVPTRLRCGGARKTDRRTMIPRRAHLKRKEGDTMNRKKTIAAFAVLAATVAMAPAGAAFAFSGFGGVPAGGLTPLPSVNVG